MAAILEKLPDFPGFAVEYEIEKNPFFKPIMVENLRMLWGKGLGKLLIGRIGAAQPKSRGDFPASVNCVCRPMKFEIVQTGYSPQYHYNADYTRTLVGIKEAKDAGPVGCPFRHCGGSNNSAVDKTAATNGNGSVCHMNFTNAQIFTNKGELSRPFIVLAHELIHTMHAVEGVTKDGKDEELWTTGIGIYEDEQMSENAFRKLFGMGRRNAYF